MPDCLSKKELEKLAYELAHLSPAHVREFYQKAWRACALEKGIPRPRVVQELVTAWKLLRNWK